MDDIQRPLMNAGFRIRYICALAAGKAVLLLLSILGRKGTAMPGRVALALCPGLLTEIGRRCARRAIITGTNGKTTTNNLLYHILNRPGISVLSNLRGSNMRQGIASAFLADTRDHYDWGLFEFDERAFRGIAPQILPEFVLVTNFFRDQLDRFGEIESTVAYVRDTLDGLDCTVVLNCDDPFTAGLSTGRKKCVFYGVRPEASGRTAGHIAETLFCPSCGSRLEYSAVHYGQLGIYECASCGNRNPEPDLCLVNIREGKGRFLFDVAAGSSRVMDVSFRFPGFYNLYNCAAAWALARTSGTGDAVLRAALEGFDYKLGRMEEMQVLGRSVRLTLVKNPVGFSEVLKELSGESGTQALLLVLNDNDNDGRDVSWIWDVDFEILKGIRGLKAIFCSGRRSGDMAVRLKYAGIDPGMIKSVDSGIRRSVTAFLTGEADRFHILPTYSALFQVRDLLASLESGSKPGAANE